jgi:hypothetical protein
VIQNKITKVQALVKLMKDNGGQANWNTIYQKIGTYYPDLNHTKGEKHTEIAKAGIRGVLYRDCDKGRNIFTKVGNATFALKSSQ